MDNLLANGWTVVQVACLQAHTSALDFENDFEYADNSRYARVGHVDEEREYENIRENGCCGGYDTIIATPDGDIRFGFNYGH